MITHGTHTFPNTFISAIKYCIRVVLPIKFSPRTIWILNCKSKKRLRIEMGNRATDQDNYIFSFQYLAPNEHVLNLPSRIKNSFPTREIEVILNKFCKFDILIRICYNFLAPSTQFVMIYNNTSSEFCFDSFCFIDASA